MNAMIDNICRCKITKCNKVMLKSLLEYICLRSHVIHHLEAANSPILRFINRSVVAGIFQKVNLEVLLAKLMGIVVVYANIYPPIKALRRRHQRYFLSSFDYGDDLVVFREGAYDHGQVGILDKVPSFNIMHPQSYASIATVFEPLLEAYLDVYTFE